ncbi:cupin domain-containing protein [Paenibacillus polysaccharolyticus]|uniref:cupin domain-containing protein n=1 Tax=Paenibacillus polysaccharolyticus TaxID=582692 RepID=UPI00203A6F34|nr:cupin domain-containing protein [Paenibacillus polysaccharolyticus]MCM3135642.1 cupin domain-containing protein [Paenibacillus polysaccharolyticus]
MRDSGQDHSDIQSMNFQDDGVIPNHPYLPVLLYKGVWCTEPTRAESNLNRNGWGNSWINGVYDYHHYHSNAHEALAVISGFVRLIIGGENGKKVYLESGDVVVLPAGTGHKRLEASPDFQVAGAYPGGMRYNTRTGKPGERPEVLQEILEVPVPGTDPVYGEGGPLTWLWINRRV